MIQTRRYYPEGAGRPLETMIKHGDARSISGWVREHAELGLDLIILMPVVADIGQVERLAAAVLPDYQ